ncbi:MAG: DsrE/DsrF/TusD sulfur relay family protein [Promethearchaeota archaeon]
MTKTLTFILTKGPYSSEIPYTVLKLVKAARNKGVNINLFFYLDGTFVSHHKQSPGDYPNVEHITHDLLKKGLLNPKIDAIACIKCTHARGITHGDDSFKEGSAYTYEGVVIGGLGDLAIWLKDSDKTLIIS